MVLHLRLMAEAGRHGRMSARHFKEPFYHVHWEVKFPIARSVVGKMGGWVLGWLCS